MLFGMEMMLVYGQLLDLPGHVIFWKKLVSESVHAPQTEHYTNSLFLLDFIYSKTANSTTKQTTYT